MFVSTIDLYEGEALLFIVQAHPEALKSFGSIKLWLEYNWKYWETAMQTGQAHIHAQVINRPIEKLLAEVLGQSVPLTLPSCSHFWRPSGQARHMTVDRTESSLLLELQTISSSNHCRFVAVWYCILLFCTIPIKMQQKERSNNFNCIFFSL